MIIKFDKSFIKDITKLKNKNVADDVKKLIANLETLNNISEVKNVKKMEGFTDFYRIRIGDYRIGIELENNNSITFLKLKHRKDIYKYFP